MEQGENCYAKTIEFMNKDNNKFNEFIKSIIKPVKDHFKNDNYGIIVDIGSGPGIATKLLSRELRAERIIGIDFDENAVEFAKNNNFGENIQYLQQNISEGFELWHPELQKLCGKVSLIFSNQVLQLIKSDLLNQTIGNLKRLLSKDGVLAFSLISDYSSKERDEHKRFFTIESEEEKIGQMLTTLRDNGLSNISLNYCHINYSVPEDVFIKYFIPVEKCFIKLRIRSTDPSNADIDEVLENIIWKQCERKVLESGHKVIKFPDNLWTFFVTQ